MEFLIFLIIIYHLLLFWIRQVNFYSKPKFENNPDSNILCSPSQGRVVYCNDITINNSSFQFMKKDGRRIPVPDCLEDGDYLHIGIFMSPLNNHHMVTMFDTQRIQIIENHFDSLESMFSWKEAINIFGYWKNWFEKKGLGFISKNRRTVFRTGDKSIIYCIIYDKFVNKFDILYNPEIEGRKIIGFVYRGSQCDIFLNKKDYNYKVLFEVGQKVSFDNKLILRTIKLKH